MSISRSHTISDEQALSIARKRQAAAPAGRSRRVLFISLQPASSGLVAILRTCLAPGAENRIRESQSIIRCLVSLIRSHFTALWKAVKVVAKIQRARETIRLRNTVGQILDSRNAEAAATCFCHNCEVLLQ
jgi:hypothetical protein